jgi:hypothetical protein
MQHEEPLTYQVLSTEDNVASTFGSEQEFQLFQTVDHDFAHNDEELLESFLNDDWNSADTDLFNHATKCKGLPMMSALELEHAVLYFIEHPDELEDSMDDQKPATLSATYERNPVALNTTTES